MRGARCTQFGRMRGCRKGESAAGASERGRSLISIVSPELPCPELPGILIDIVGAVVADPADLHAVEVEGEVLGAGRRAVGGLRSDHDLPDRVGGVGDLLGRGSGSADIGEEVVGVVGEAGGGGAAALRVGNGLLQRVWQLAGM